MAGSRGRRVDSVELDLESPAGGDLETPAAVRRDESPDGASGSELESGEIVEAAGRPTASPRCGAEAEAPGGAAGEEGGDGGRMDATSAERPLVNGAGSPACEVGPSPPYDGGDAGSDAPPPARGPAEGPDPSRCSPERAPLPSEAHARSKQAKKSRARDRSRDRGRGRGRDDGRRRRDHGHASRSWSAGRRRGRSRSRDGADREKNRRKKSMERSRSRSHGRGERRDRRLEAAERRKEGERRRDGDRRRSRRSTSRSRSRSKGRRERERRERRGRRRGEGEEGRGGRGEGRSKRKRSRSKGRRGSDAEEEDEDYKARVVAALENAEEDEDKLIEERRRRRQEILNKHRQEGDGQEDIRQEAAAHLTPDVVQRLDTPPTGRTSPAASDSIVSATPPPDRHLLVQELGAAAAAGGSGPHEQNSPPEDQSSGEAADTTQMLEEKGTTSTGLDAEDIFCDAPVGKGDGGAEGKAARKASAGKGLADAYDDPDGYYNFQFGEIIGQRYEVFASKGRGVFSTVVRAWDRSRRNGEGRHREVAIKILRSNDVMKKSGQAEEQILKLLASTDPDDRRHCIRLLSSFEHRGHLCLVFEVMEMNLRELTAKFGRNVGLNINAVGHYTAQLLDALRHLKANEILHADIKPDNILVNDKFSKVKICDFGSAMASGDAEVTPYLVSRFYRAPEIILGLRYDYPMDLWSVGCVVYELFTGKILFPGKSNNEMLKLMMDVKGPFPKKKLKKGRFHEEHFESDPNMSFIQVDTDPVTKKPIKRLIVNPTVKKDFKALLLQNAGDSDRELVLLLADLLDKMMALDPEQRIDLEKARRHPFLKKILQKAVKGTTN